MADFYLKMVWYVYSHELVKIPMSPLTNQFMLFERKFRNGSSLNCVKSSKVLGNISKICRFNELKRIAKSIPFKFDLLYSLG